MRESEKELWDIIQDMSAEEVSYPLVEASSLLERFFDAYSEMVPTNDPELNKAYLQWHSKLFGSHWIRTEEGWEPGEAKESYLQDYGPDSILEEIGSNNDNC